MHEHDRPVPAATAATGELGGLAGLAPVLLGAAAASIGAGLVHAAVAGTHAGADTLVRLFAATAAVQVAWGALVSLRPRRWVLLAGAVLNGGAVVAWALSRSRGLPWPAGLEAVEEVGTQDVIAASLGAVAAVAAVLALLRPALRAPRLGPPPLGALLAGAAALALAVPGMASAHNHGPSHDHGHGGDAASGVAADHPHDGDAAARHGHGDQEGAATPTGPIISLDDPRVTDAERAAAQSLIDATLAAMAPYTDQAAVEAAGYRSIGDAPTGHEHFVNYGYLLDGVELDPARVESIVMSVGPQGKAVVSAMYILSPGKDMDDVPEIAGELTAWHDHQNLCWEGTQVVGTTDATGSCTRGTFRPTPPMLHVWTVPNPCGPFAGITGHGDGCAHGH